MARLRCWGVRRRDSPYQHLYRDRHAALVRMGCECDLRSRLPRGPNLHRDSHSSLQALRHRHHYQPHPRLRLTDSYAHCTLLRWHRGVAEDLCRAHRRAVHPGSRGLHSPDRCSVQPPERPHTGLHRPSFLQTQVQRQEDPRDLLHHAQERDRPGGIERRPCECGKGDDAASPRLAVVRTVEAFRGGRRGEVEGDFPGTPCRNDRETYGRYNGGEGDQMTVQAKDNSGFWQNLLGGDEGKAPQEAPAVTEASQQLAAPEIEIAPNDPIMDDLASASGVVEIDKLDLDSAALRAMKQADIKVVVPLVSQGELIGLLNLGPRLSQQEYSADDRKLLNDLATQTAPAVQVAQLVRQQQQQAQERERIEQELRVARLIQQTLLPKHVPNLPGYQLAAYYQPAREVGGDFYDFLEFEDGHLGIIVGDVTDKGVPAALVMATTRTMLRASAQRLDSPGEVLRQVNDVMVPDIPPNMFVTCLYAILNPRTGRLRYANAGQDLPYQRHKGRPGDTSELRATGMPLGLMPGMSYEEKEAVLEAGDSILFYTDGLVEAHDPKREMFGIPRLQGFIGAHPGGAPMIDFLLEELARFVGGGWEQEDDITLVTLQRSEAS